VKAALFERFGGEIEVTDVPDPAPPPGGAVIEVHANGVCRSDWHAWVGHDASIALPHVPGHEMSGVVAAVGEGVGEELIGTRITVPFVLGCGSCRLCLSGNQQVCENQYQAGFSGWGSFARYVALPYADGNIVTLPESMSFDTAAGLGCRFATAFRAVVDQGSVGEETTVAVWGCGGVGLSAVMIASALGARVVAVDIHDDALDLARRFGATETVNAETIDDPVAAVRGVVSGGVEVSIDALGSTETSRNSIRALAPRGRHIQVGLMIGDDAKPVVPMWRLHANEIELYGSHGMAAWRYPAMLDMIEGRRLDPAALVTKTFDLSGGIDHLKAMDSFPGTGFAVITDFPE